MDHREPSAEDLLWWSLERRRRVAALVIEGAVELVEHLSREATALEVLAFGAELEHRRDMILSEPPPWVTTSASPPPLHRSS